MAYYRQRTVGRMGAPRPRTVQATTMPSCTGGVNGLDALIATPPEDCIYTFNMMPVEYGMRLRKGYREWATGCKENPARGTGQVRTIMPYESQTQDQAEDRLWAVTDEGIWNITQFNTTAPVQDVAFTQLGPDAGYGVFCEYTNDSERHFLFYADGLNGIHQYEQGVGWSVPANWTYEDPDNPGTQIPFPVENVAFVMVHKLRIWVILEDKDDAWYLPLYSIAGELKKFTFGSKMTHGGNLMCLVDWTVDGGDGVDDYLVAVSRGGDVCLYRGADPEDQSWSNTGTWFVGEVPESRRLTLSFGPDVYVLSTYGVTSIQDLLRGTVADITRTSRSAKVNRFLRADIEAGKDLRGWSINDHPGDGFIQIVTPEPSNTPYVQYNQNVATGAWGFWKDVPMISAQTWNGDYFIGANDGIVHIYDDVLDGTTLSEPNSFNGTVVGTPGPEWTVPVAGEYACDGTQTGDTFYKTTATTPLLTQQYYTVSYEVKDWVSGQHGIALASSIEGIVEGTPLREGNGKFTFQVLTTTVVPDEVWLVGDVDFKGTMFNIVVQQQGALGNPINWQTLTSFQPPNGNHVTFKRAHFIRTLGVLAGTAIIDVKAVWDYRIEDFVGDVTPAPRPDEPLWDSAIWDESRWDFGTTGRSKPQGALGMGRVAAIAMAGSATTRINIIGWDFMYTEGGYL